MEKTKKVRLLLAITTVGLCFVLLGYYFIAYANLPETYGVMGIVISAVCITFGIILSLPTKIYLAILMMEKEKPMANDTKD